MLNFVKSRTAGKKYITPIIISVLLLFLFSCITFQTINQPTVSPPNSIITVTISAETGGGEYEPFFGVCIPEGWTVPGDTIQCSGAYSEVIYFDSLISSWQENVSPAPVGYYWWAGNGMVDTNAGGLVYADLHIQTDSQMGRFSIDYMLGDGYNGVNNQRSNGHQIEITEEFTPWGLNAAVSGDSVIINWCQPFNANGLLGYFIYRDGQQINPLLVTDTTFIDENPLEGIHYYCVSSYCSNGSEYLVPYEVQIMFGNSLYVSPNGSNSNSGSSFGEALLTIDYALSVLSPDSLNRKTIYLSEGVFSQSTTGEIFPLEWENYVSLKGISAETILDGEDSLSGVLQFNSITESKIENLTVRGGYGIGIYLHHSSPKLINTAVEDNNGIGIECRDYSSPTLINVTIEDNNGNGIECRDHSAPSLKNVNISSNNGSGIYCRDNSSPKLENVTIMNNSTENGGGIYCARYSNPTLDSVIITNNVASQDGGGIYCGNNSNPQLDNVLISYNSAGRGGGIHCSNNSNPQFIDVYIVENYASIAAGIRSSDSNPILQNTLIANNISSYLCGGMVCYRSNPLLLNVTITGNSAPYYEGIFCQSYSNPIIKNCILWNNNNTEIYVYNSTITISYSDIQGGEEGVITNNGTVYWLDGNRDENPLFVETGDHPYALLSGSPCIDAGDPNTIYNDPEDPNNLGYALWPAMGTLRNDIGAYGGPNAASWKIIVTAIENEDTEELQIPTDFDLSQNYPNPFNPTTTIQYSIKERSSVELVLYDILGRQVEVLVKEEQDAGYYKINFNAGYLASGIYLYRLKAGNFVETKKMVLLR